MSFTPEVYAQIREGAKRSAAEVVPLVFDLYNLPDARPLATVVDVGGGEGWWAHEFAMHGCQCCVLDESVEEEHDTEDGVHFDHLALDTLDAQMVTVPPAGRYDLAVCLEVAEHVPDEFGQNLVNGLCTLSDVILWSAAIPYQGGHGHINEQWPQWWADRFRIDHGLFASEVLRYEIWDDLSIEPWYRQNMLLYANEQWFEERKITYTASPRSVVHPAIYNWRIEERDRLNKLLYP
jgi:hypothetical protein